LNAGYENLINGNYYYPDKPTKTIYFNASDMTTTNQSASYWHAFTIKRTGATMAEKIGKASFYNAVNGQVLEFENGRIVTNAAEMQ
jgi:ATP sulfurylase